MKRSCLGTQAADRTTGEGARRCRATCHWRQVCLRKKKQKQARKQKEILYTGKGIREGAKNFLFPWTKGRRANDVRECGGGRREEGRKGNKTQSQLGVNFVPREETHRHHSIGRTLSDSINHGTNCCVSERRHARQEEDASVDSLDGHCCTERAHNRYRCYRAPRPRLGHHDRQRRSVICRSSTNARSGRRHTKWKSHTWDVGKLLRTQYKLHLRK